MVDKTATSSPAGRLPTVEESWARIDAWLAEHAPLSRARLRPPASAGEIAEGERWLGVTFHPELVASLRCHDGVEPGEGAPAFALNGRFAGVTDIVSNTLFLRGIGEDVEDLYDDEGELGAYWRHEWLMITDGVSGDAHWSALDEPLPRGLVLPVLGDVPEWSWQPVTEIRDFDLGALVERTPASRLRAAMVAQLRRLAAETRLDASPEATQTLAGIERGDSPELVEDGPLDLRMRTLVAEAAAARPAMRPPWQRGRDEPELPTTPEDFQAWQLRADAADALRRFLQLPLPVAAQSILHRRLSEDWRSELAQDLAAQAVDEG